jgi:membrane protein
MSALIDTMNAQYGVREDRPYWKHHGTAILLSIVSGILFLMAGTIMLISMDFLGPPVAELWSICRWPVALALVSLALAVIYRYAPNLKSHPWRWITPGTIIGLVLWLGVSYGFRLYLRYFDAYGAVYGSLGTVIIAMLWFYISSLAILLGGEVNAVLEGRAGGGSTGATGAWGGRIAEQHRGRDAAD